MRKNIWEINKDFFCPIAGFCLSYPEQKEVIKKLINKDKYKVNQRIMHNLIISAISVKSPFAKFIHKFLDRKFKNEISYILSFNKDEYMNNIQQFLTPEYFGAFIWTLAIHTDLTSVEEDFVLGRIHNYSHEMYFELYKISRQIENLSAQNTQLAQKYRNVRSAQKSTELELQKKEQELNEAKYQIRKIEDKANLLHEMEEHLADLKMKIQKLEDESKAKDNEIFFLKSENKKLKKKQDAQLTDFLKIEHEFDNLLVSLKSHNEKCQDCDRINLCNLRVLIVGGISKIESHYRKLIQELGGDFYYHHGNCAQNKSILSNLINKADVVFCPVDVNSHAACLQVKKECKKKGIDYYMLRKSSVSTIYNTLVDVHHTRNCM